MSEDLDLVSFFPPLSYQNLGLDRLSLLSQVKFSEILDLSAMFIQSC